MLTDATAHQPALPQAEQAGHSAASPRELPRLTFVLINWNYGRYVGAAIDSIRAQDYPAFDCLVVDNGSTDNSRRVIADHVGNDARFTVMHLPANIGQLAAALHVLDNVSSDYVCFVDSDDYIFPHFGSTHVQAHLVVPASVGVTSSNIIEITGDGTMLTACPEDFARRTNSREIQEGAVRAIRLPQIDQPQFSTLIRAMRVIDKSTNGWLWVAGTANVYRRSALRLARLLLPDQIPVSFFQDTTFLCAAHLVHGSATIDLPLSSYRIHEDNVGSAFCLLQGFSTPKPSAKQRSRDQRCAHGASFIRNRSKIGEWLPRNQIWPALDQVMRCRREAKKTYYSSAPMLSALSDHFSEFYPELRSRRALASLREGLSFTTLWKLSRRLDSARSRWAMRMRLLLIEAGRGLGSAHE